MNKIGIVGLGYVGLPLALQFAKSGVTVVGLDVDQKKIDAINAGQSYIEHIPAEIVAEHVTADRFSATADFSVVQELDAVLICVPTPLSKHREPDISYVLQTGEAIAPYLKPDETTGIRKLIVLESTTFPGTTETDLREVLEKCSGLKAGEDFHLAYSPEREDPGRSDHSVKSIPKVMGGYTVECLTRCRELYLLALQKVHPVSSCSVAEATKLTENIFRSVNIALVNELKMVYHAMGIDVWEVINAAATKPFGYMPFYPGPGLGGHCIPIDPFYLTWKAREFEQYTRFIELAGEINTRMPDYVIERVVASLNEVGKALKNSRILVLGLAYKPNVDDDRESPSYSLMDKLKQRGAEVSYYDPHVPVIKPTREHPHWEGLKSVQWNRDSIASFDAVIVSTAHRVVNYQELADWSNCIIDTRNVMAGIPPLKASVWKA